MHDAAEAGDMEALTRMLRPPKKAGGGGGVRMDEEGTGGTGGGDGGADGVRSGKVNVLVCANDPREVAGVGLGENGICC